VFENGEIEHATLLAGPVVTYATNQWWVTLTLPPQVAGLAGATFDGLNLEEFECAQVCPFSCCHFTCKRGEELCGELVS
jgi:hypothetical protein